MSAPDGHGESGAGVAVATARPVVLVRYRSGVVGETASPADGVGAGLAAGGACYQQWGWPVILHRDQVRLSLYREASALAIPVPLGAAVIEILARRGCAPAVLAHPYTPDHHILLTGERYGVTLPWPAQVHQVTGALLLPPTVTPRGPITWAQPPREDSLRQCREIDLFAALRTALSDGVRQSGMGQE